MRRLPFLAFCLVAVATCAAAQQSFARPITEKQKKLREARAPWKQWLNEEVVYIITDQEKRTFQALKSDDEREQFADTFWLRRDRDQHYRRMAYANDRFASGIPGWKTDRGRNYIMYGPADEIESHPATHQESGTAVYPSETWRYRCLEGIGRNVEIGFVDNAFERDEKLGIYLQAYNFGFDQQTHKAQGTVRYDFVKAGTDETVSSITEDVANLPGGAAQVRVEHLMPLRNFEPGAYILKVTIVDTQRNQTVAQAADFRVL